MVVYQNQDRGWVRILISLRFLFSPLPFERSKEGMKNKKKEKILGPFYTSSKQIFLPWAAPTPEPSTFALRPPSGFRVHSLSPPFFSFPWRQKRLGPRAKQLGRNKGAENLQLSDTRESKHRITSRLRRREEIERARS